MNSIRNKILVAIVLITLPSLLAIGWYGGRNIEQTLRSHGLEALEVRSDRLKSEMQGMLAFTEGDLLLLADAPTVGQYLLAVGSGDERLGDAARGNLTQAFARLSEIRGDYRQIRFLDASGKERIRVARDGGDTFTVSPGSLADESASPFYTEARRATRGRVLVSPLGLARDKGQIESPEEPEIRYATPIYDASSKVRGVIAIHFAAAPILAVADKLAQGGELVYFVLEDGSYAVHPDPARTWMGDADKGGGAGIDAEFPALGPKVLAATEPLREEDDERFALAGPVEVPGSAGRRLGTLLVLAPTSELYATASDFRSFFNVLTLAALLAVLVLGTLVAHWVTKPIVDLTEAADRMSRGDLEAPITASSNDETRTLAESMERLRKSMKVILDKYA